ncbi:hypothetical protein CAOG_00526 [Capsaspora owczarzaki ATCC 30864]|uniref:SET domain-containing protein n=1 Tax=Capsaspora owczarzaki (strain ATCC 30864) TaxID=595528 RepID=A0A0D2X0F3_CAPO3|nr:hypothetical protein CAOG_00526 [Capsaspora owczarzaki ATCC 30864]KJE88959.1 hypothetical protein CAOG_000526 [Capsaspora owczarzaki ATCC 30864]|eukprot:XP_004365397.1 hypothetical protein CAOG_00526 [Capsaspora owczarzaki ATCC 30864]
MSAEILQNVDTTTRATDLDLPVLRKTLPNGQFGVFTSRPVLAGEVLIVMPRGELAASPDRFTVQVGVNQHITGDQLGLAKFLNHHCDANAQMVVVADVDAPTACALQAVRDIPANHEVTFNYLTTEFDMDEKFTCNCSSLRCYREIRGFRHLSPDSQQLLVKSSQVAPHLLLLLQQ